MSIQGCKYIDSDVRLGAREMASDSDPDSDGPHGPMIERPRGILSKADRKYLVRNERGREEAYSRQGRNTRETAIAERFENALIDMYLLYERLTDDDLRRIVGESPPNLSAAVGLLYRIAGLGKAVPAEDTFRGWLRAGIADVLEEQSKGIEIRPSSVEFDVSEPEVLDLESIDAKLVEEGPGALTQDELLLLLYLLHRDPESTEDIEADETFEAIADHLDEKWELKGQLILPTEVYEPDSDDDDDNDPRFEEIDEQEQAEAEQLAEKALVLQDIHAMERDGLSARARLQTAYGIDATDFDDEQELLAAVRAARNQTDSTDEV